ncbi:MAG: MBL fold metallo-hydrolase [Muribaculaceae bacterium]|nr:MBL fold metallo-hydrolase [Muribaculaceae bacterium]
MLSVKKFEVNMFAENTFIVFDVLSREAAVIDAGMLYDDEWQDFSDYVEKGHLKIKYLLNTHLHIDHLFGVAEAVRRYGVGLSASSADSILSDRVEQQAAMFGIRRKMEQIKIEHPLADGDEIRLGNSTLKVIATPGHSLGGICFYSADDGLLFSGDSLFQTGIGRTDLPGGDYATLIHSITDRLLTLPDDTKVLPGHGPSTTISQERQYNPFL